VPHPGISITTGPASRPPGDSIDTGTAFLVGEVTSGPPSTPTLITSPSQFVGVFGERDADSPALYDAVVDAFRAGLSRAWVVGVPDISSSDALTAALGSFTASLGPGQVYAPDATTAAQQLAVIAAAAQYGRSAVIQLADGAASAQAAAAASLAASASNAEVASVWGTWVTVPGLTSGTTRVAPVAGLVLGRIAAVDEHYGDPGHAAAGTQGWGAGVLDQALATSRPYTDTVNGDLDTLHDAGVNVAVQQSNGSIQIRDFVSLSDAPEWSQWNFQRLRMGIVANVQRRMEPFLFRTFDSRGHLLTEVSDSVSAYLQDLFDNDVLFGETAQEAYAVDTSYGPGQVNTPASVADGQLRAAVTYVPAPHVDAITITITAEAIAA
jgi:hypothetical protein